jgi:two-component system CheB/CheR fusion protein
MEQKARKGHNSDAKPAGAQRGSSPEEKASNPSSSDAHFPIVGVGASAGGLEALEQFLGHVPDGSGMAFVIVQHLDPTHKGIMPELLQRATTMKVVQVKERQKVEPNCVYVIPPNKDMSILHGVLHLMEPVAPRGLRLPIDSFLRSLAEDMQDLAVGVILSGMGSDGTLGLRAIKEQAGVALVQDPASAKFDGMPRSAIDAGLADIVAPVEELPGKIIAYLRHVPPVAMPEVAADDKGHSGLEKVIALLRSHTGHDFFQYKKSTLYRRIERRMAIHQIGKICHYVRYLQENPGERDLLFKELLIGVTSFFRDPEEWARLRDKAIAPLLSGSQPGHELRAWVVGCSTGEEAYSLAIVFKEAMEQVKPSGSFSLQIFATDLDQDAIDRARQGVYPENIAADVSPERLSRFFTEDQDGYCVSKEIREMVIFAQQNVIKDPPFTRLDIVTCRNLLIYMEQELQRTVLRLFHYCLKPDGSLLLGNSETVGGFTDLFAALNGRSRLYKRLKSDVQLEPIEFPRALGQSLAGAQHQQQAPTSEVNLQSLADQLLLQSYSPAAVLVNSKGDVLYISGRTGKYLEPAAGKANWNIFVMAREGLRYELIGAFQKALRQKERLILRNLTVGTDGGTQAVDLTIQVVEEPEALRGLVMIVFTEVAPSPETTAMGGAKRATSGHSRLAQAELELQHVREEMQGVREQMQTSQEELRSANEELQSANEELQSTNEELTTSREEMQSLNEELHTVNNELQTKVDELSMTSDDMKNLLNSTDIATVFLDSALRVRRFTHEATSILRLIPGDVGRPVTDITSDLFYPELCDDVLEVLRTLVFAEKQVSTHDGRWFAVRVMPYRTVENKIDGVVITFMDITDSKILETELRQLMESLPQLVWTCGPEGSCDHLNRQWVEYTGIPEADQLGYGWLQQLHPEDRERVATEWRAVVETGTHSDTKFRIRSKDGEYRRFRMRAAPVRDGNGKILKWYGINTDIEEMTRVEDALRESEEHSCVPLENSQVAGVVCASLDITERSTARKSDEEATP